MKYHVIYEQSAKGWSAYSPDLPGLGAGAETLEETKKLIRERWSSTSRACEGKVARSQNPARQLKS